MASDAPSPFAAIGMLIVGICIAGLGLFVLLPVAVNLPDSWPGAVLAVALLGVGGALVYAAKQGLRTADPK